MLARGSDGRLAPLLRQQDLPTQLVELRALRQGQRQALRMVDPVGEVDRSTNVGHRLIGITERPERKGRDRVAADAGVVPAEPEGLGVVLARVVDSDGLIGMIATLGELAEVKPGGPLGMVGLKEKCCIALPFRQAGQLVGERARA